MKTNSEQENLLFSEERREKIRKLVKSKGKILVKDLSLEFNVSEVTIRQDLTKLEKMGILVRTYGGAIEKNNSTQDTPLSERIEKRLPQKIAIAREAYKYISDNDSIILDGGSTVLELGRLIRHSENLHISAVVNFIPLITLLQDKTDINLTLLGGTYFSRLFCSLGPIANQNMNSMFVDKAFISTTAFSVEQGLSCTSIQEADLRKTMISRASMKILLADSSKINKCSFISSGSLDQINVLITDWEISKTDIKEISDLGIKVIAAGRN